MTKYEVCYKEIRTDGGSIDGRYVPGMMKAEDFVAIHGREAFERYWLHEIKEHDAYTSASVMDGCSSELFDTREEASAFVDSLAAVRPYKRCIVAYEIMADEYDADLDELDITEMIAQGIASYAPDVQMEEI